jgi:hypothetical protein
VINFITKKPFTIIDLQQLDAKLKLLCLKKIALLYVFNILVTATISTLIRGINVNTLFDVLISISIMSAIIFLPIIWVKLKLKNHDNKVASKPVKNNKTKNPKAKNTKTKKSKAKKTKASNVLNPVGDSEKERLFILNYTNKVKEMAGKEEIKTLRLKLTTLGKPT